MRLPKRIIVLSVLLALATSIFSTAFAVEKFTSKKKTIKPAKRTMAKPAKKTVKPAKKTVAPAKKTVAQTVNTTAPAKPNTANGVVVAPTVVTAIPMATLAPVTYPPREDVIPAGDAPPMAPTGAPATAETSIPRPYGCATRAPYFNKCDMEFDCSLKQWGTTDKPRHQRSTNTCELVAVNFGRESATFTFTKVGVAQRALATWVGVDERNPIGTDIPFSMETGPGVPGSPDFMKITVPYNPPGPDPENDLYTLFVETTPPGVLSNFVRMGTGTYRFYPWAANPARNLTLTPW